MSLTGGHLRCETHGKGGRLGKGVFPAKKGQVGSDTSQEDTERARILLGNGKAKNLTVLG